MMPSKRQTRGSRKVTALPSDDPTKIRRQMYRDYLEPHLRDHYARTGEGIAQLCHRLDISRSNFYGIWGSTRHFPSAEVIHRIATGLNIDPDPLYVICGKLPPELEALLMDRQLGVSAIKMLRKYQQAAMKAQETQTYVAT